MCVCVCVCACVFIVECVSPVCIHVFIWLLHHYERKESRLRVGKAESACNCLFFMVSYFCRLTRMR